MQVDCWLESAGLIGVGHGPSPVFKISSHSAQTFPQEILRTLAPIAVRILNDPQPTMRV